ncbi:MAG: oxidoreductase [Betaproteobacteria bacterium]|nr:oxidoreductase [Betaproteobacteria bacterium]
MKKWNLVIDVKKCFGCEACAVTCHDEYHDNEFPGYAASMAKHGQRWIDVLQREKGRFPMVEVVHLPVTCNHCDDAPCVKAARDGAVRKREDGIVIIDPVKAKGQRQLVDACPYGAIHWNGERQLPQAWPFDAHLLDEGWTRTRASQVCPTQAIRTVHADDEEMQRMVAREGLEVLHPEYKTGPRVYYKNLDHYFNAFVGGTVAGNAGGVTECVEGAEIVLKRGGLRIAATRSDAYGDFKFRGLEEGSGGHHIEIAAERYLDKAIEVDLASSTYLGTIALEARAPRSR